MRNNPIIVVVFFVILFSKSSNSGIICVSFSYDNYETNKIGVLYLEI